MTITERLRSQAVQAHELLAPFDADLLTAAKFYAAPSFSALKAYFADDQREALQQQIKFEIKDMRDLNLKLTFAAAWTKLQQTEPELFEGLDSP
jgi:hypothetical protein